MTLANYLYEKMQLFFLNIFCAIALCIYFVLLGNSLSSLVPVLIIWIAILFTVWGYGYWKQKEKAAKLLHQLENLDQKYLICEMLEKPNTYADTLFHHVLRISCKSMLEHVNKLKNSKRQHKEYIEEWVHEIKTPITAIDLISKNHANSHYRRIQKELSRIDYLVEQVLYYARSEQVEKDYFIKEFSLFDALTPALLQNRSLLLEENITLRVQETSDIVCTDEKWLTYILNQILSNAIKYRRSRGAYIQISATHTENSVNLIIADNGVGIAPEDLPRIFEKGFTGCDRSKSNSTGMGLYLCHKLCIKLGLTIHADSVSGEGTTITIGFPYNTFAHPEKRD